MAQGASDPLRNPPLLTSIYQRTCLAVPTVNCIVQEDLSGAPERRVCLFWNESGHSSLAVTRELHRPLLLRILDVPRSRTAKRTPNFGSFLNVRHPPELRRAQFRWMSDIHWNSKKCSSNGCPTFTGTAHAAVPHAVKLRWDIRLMQFTAQLNCARNCGVRKSKRSLTAPELRCAEVQAQFNCTGTPLCGSPSAV